MANAYFIKNYQIGYNLKRSSKSLLLPYILVCVVTAMLCVNINDDMSTNYRVFGARILDMIGGISKKSELFPRFESVWMVWFVVCLFAARMIYIVSMRVLKKAPEIIRLLAVCLLTYTGYYIGTNISFLPWSLDIALFAQIFMWFGDFIHRKGSSYRISDISHVWAWWSGFVDVEWILARTGYKKISGRDNLYCYCACR